MASARLFISPTHKIFRVVQSDEVSRKRENQTTAETQYKPGDDEYEVAGTFVGIAQNILRDIEQGLKYRRALTRAIVKLDKKSLNPPHFSNSKAGAKHWVEDYCYDLLGDDFSLKVKSFERRDVTGWTLESDKETIYINSWKFDELLALHRKGLQHTMTYKGLIKWLVLCTLHEWEHLGGNRFYMYAAKANFRPPTPKSIRHPRLCYSLHGGGELGEYADFHFLGGKPFYDERGRNRHPIHIVDGKGVKHIIRLSTIKRWTEPGRRSGFSLDTYVRQRPESYSARGSSSYASSLDVKPARRSRSLESPFRHPSKESRRRHSSSQVEGRRNRRASREVAHQQLGHANRISSGKQRSRSRERRNRSLESARYGLLSSARSAPAGLRPGRSSSVDSASHRRIENWLGSVHDTAPNLGALPQSTIVSNKPASSHSSRSRRTSARYGLLSSARSAPAGLRPGRSSSVDSASHRRIEDCLGSVHDTAPSHVPLSALPQSTIVSNKPASSHSSRSSRTSNSVFSRSNSASTEASSVSSRLTSAISDLLSCGGRNV